MDPLITTWAERAERCRNLGDDISADYWAERAQELSDREHAQQRRCAPVSFYAETANA